MSNIPPYKELDPRVQRTMGLFYSALVDLLKEKHYTKIKVQEITKKANLNRATFYRHFGNITEFIIYCSREGFRRELVVRFELEKYAYNTINLKILVKWVLEFMCAEYAKWHYQWDEIIFEKALRMEFYYFLTEWITFPTKSPDMTLYRDTYALVLSSSIIGLGLEWCHHGCPEEPEELAARITQIFTAGLPGLNELETA